MDSNYSCGAYDYFGEETFLNAKYAILEKANAEYDFLVGMNGEEPDFPIDFRQIYSDTFIEWLVKECDMHGFEQGIDEEKSEGKILEKAQNIDEMGGFAPDIYGAYEVEDVVRMVKGLCQ